MVLKNICVTIPHQYDLTLQESGTWEITSVGHDLSGAHWVAPSLLLMLSSLQYIHFLPCIIRCSWIKFHRICSKWLHYSLLQECAKGTQTRANRMPLPGVAMSLSGNRSLWQVWLCCFRVSADLPKINGDLSMDIHEVCIWWLCHLQT